MWIILPEPGFARSLGTFAPASSALVRIFASDFVRCLLILLSSCGWRYFFGIRSLTILSLIRKIFASAPCWISFIVYIGV